MALTRADIAERLIIKPGMTKIVAAEFVDSFFEEIARNLEVGEMVKLTGFGNFELKLKNARPGRNPKTGKEVTISERRVTTFRAGQKLKNRIDDSTKEAKSDIYPKSKLKDIDILIFVFQKGSLTAFSFSQDYI